MTRLKALKWCWENIRYIDNGIFFGVVQDKIGIRFTDELLRMGFIHSRFCEVRRYSEYYMSNLGVKYCEELFG